MQYLKHYYVQATNKITYITNTNNPTTGRTLPRIDGLETVFEITDVRGIDVCLSTCPDETVVDLETGLHPRDGGIWLLQYEDWLQEFVQYYERLKTAKISRLYEVVAFFREKDLQHWSTSSEQSLFYLKYNRALLVRDAENDTAADSVSPLLYAEATERQITTKQLAEKIIANYNSFTQKEAKIAGIRGRLADQITALSVDTTDFETIKAALPALNTIDIDPATIFADI